MAAIRWTDKLALGLAFMDEDHRDAADLLNAIMDAHRAGGADLGQRIEDFRGHCEAHFAREEAHMRRHAFPAFPIHKREHVRVLAELEEFIKGLDGADPAAVEAYVLQTLPDWFLRHLATMDSATASFILQAQKRSS